MSEYINKDETVTILERLRDRCGNDDMAFALNWAADTVKSMSAADAKEVVYCRDCKYYQNNGYFGLMGPSLAGVSLCMHENIPVTTLECCPIDEPYLAPDEDFYCALGEKADEPGVTS